MRFSISPFYAIITLCAHFIPLVPLAAEPKIERLKAQPFPFVQGQTHSKLDLLIERIQSLKEPRSQDKQNPTSSTIVPLRDQITDFEARLELARVLSHGDDHLPEAIEQYQILLKNKPHHAIAILEISRLYMRQKKFSLALTLLSSAIQENPENIDLLVEAAHTELGLYHPKQSQDLLLKALALSNNKKSILMDYASTLMMAGNFYKAEEIYRHALKTDPNSLDITLKLAWSLVSAERYEEAEGLYRRLLPCHPHNAKILEPLATLKILTKNFDAALEIIEELRTLFPQNPSYMQLEADTLYKNENFLEALKTFNHLAKHPKYYAQAMIGRAKILEILEQCGEAQDSFQKAYHRDPSLIETQYYQAGCEVIDEEFIQQIIDHTTDPEDLTKWANIYIENGMAGSVEPLFKAALKIDPDYFPAQIGLAEALSANYNYQDALDIYLSILHTFPENSKVLIAIARVYSWWKEYNISLIWYDHIITLNPQDPVPQLEKARVAYWGKLFNQSMSSYQQLLNPPVDQLLLDALAKIYDNCNPSWLAPLLHPLYQSIELGSIYRGYEEVSSQIAEYTICDLGQKLTIEKILAEYLPQYLIQKSVKLESEAKAFDWDNYHLHALPLYQELADFNPGNEEALYGYAQDFCSLGLCNYSRCLYNRILNQSPNHNLVKMALQRNLMTENPLLRSNYTYWTEQGSGQFAPSQIARQQFDECLEWSPSCDFHIRVMQNLWLEYPFFTQTYYPAEGQTLEVEQTLNPYVKGAASATYKNYFHKFPSRYSGFANLWFNLYDFAKLAIGFERKNEIYNFFCLEQGIQAKIYWTSLQTNTHSLATATTYRHLDYNDGNALDHINVIASYLFSESPDVFKLIAHANYYNTAHMSQFIVNPAGDIVNIIHPYWTPDNYFSGGATLQFRYHYTYFEYCEAPQRYIDIKLTGEADTAHNPSLQLAINWKHEFMCHWGFEITGLFHRSRLWNADGVWMQAYYRF